MGHSRVRVTRGWPTGSFSGPIGRDGRIAPNFSHLRVSKKPRRSVVSKSVPARVYLVGERPTLGRTTQYRRALLFLAPASRDRRLTASNSKALRWKQWNKPQGHFGAHLRMRNYL